MQSTVVRGVLFYKPCAWLKTAGSVKLVLHLNAVQHPENSCSAVSNLPRSLTDITFPIFQDWKYPTILPGSDLNHNSKVFFNTQTSKPYSTMDAYSGTQDASVDIEAHPTAKKLLETCQKFFSEIDNL